MDRKGEPTDGELLSEYLRPAAMGGREEAILDPREENKIAFDSEKRS